MNKKDFLKKCYTEQTKIELKLKMASFLIKQGKEVKDEEINILLERYENLKKLIKELEK